MVKNPPAMRELQVRSLGGEDPLEKEMATHPSSLAWRIQWTEEPGRLQFTGLKRVRHDLATEPPPPSRGHLSSFKVWSVWVKSRHQCLEGQICCLLVQGIRMWTRSSFCALCALLCINSIAIKELCIAQETVLNTLQWLIWEKTLKKSDYVCMYNWFTFVHLKPTQHCKSTILQ